MIHQKVLYRVFDKKTNKRIEDETYLSYKNQLFHKSNIKEPMSPESYILQHATPYRDKDNQIIFDGDICFYQVLNLYGIIRQENSVYLFDSGEHQIDINDIHKILTVIGNIRDNSNLICANNSIWFDIDHIINTHIKQQTDAYYNDIKQQSKDHIISKAFHMVVWDEIVYYFEELRDHIEWSEQDVKLFQDTPVIADMLERLTCDYKQPTVSEIEETYQTVLKLYQHNYQSTTEED